MDFQVKTRKRGKDKEMDRRKKNGGMSQKHVRIQEVEMERRKKNRLKPSAVVRKKNTKKR